MHLRNCVKDSRGNDVWKLFVDEINSVVIFQGSESYITPSWYPSKHQGGKAVPTWNHAVVHAYGRPRAIEDRAWLLDHINQLTDLHEADQALPWKGAHAWSNRRDRDSNRSAGRKVESQPESHAAGQARRHRRIAPTR